MAATVFEDEATQVRQRSGPAAGSNSQPLLDTAEEVENSGREAGGRRAHDQTREASGPDSADVDDFAERGREC